MKKQRQYYINGLVLLTLALFSITTIPAVIKNFSSIRIDNYIYVEAEFFLLTACSLFFLFSPKYYKNQIISILLAALYFFIFSRLYLALY